MRNRDLKDEKIKTTAKRWRERKAGQMPFLTAAAWEFQKTVVEKECRARVQVKRLGRRKWTLKTTEKRPLEEGQVLLTGRRKGGRAIIPESVKTAEGRVNKGNWEARSRTKLRKKPSLVPTLA